MSGVEEEDEAPAIEVPGITLIFTPAVLDLALGKAFPAVCIIEVEKSEELDIVTNGLRVAGIEYNPLGEKRLRVNFGYETLADLFPKLVTALSPVPFRYPRYWFSFTPLMGEGPVVPHFFMIDIDNSHRRLQILQNLTELEGEAAPELFSPERWLDYHVALSRLGLCANTVLVGATYGEEQTHILVELTDAAADDFEHTLHQLAQVLSDE